MRRSTILLFGSLLLAACGQHAETNPPKGTSAAPAPCAPIAQAPIPAAKPSSSPATTIAPNGIANATPSPTSSSTLTSTSSSHGHDVDVDARLVIKRLVLAKGVEKREPVSPAAAFSKAEAKHVYAFVEIDNPDKKDSEIVVSFAKVGAPDNGGVHLHVGPSRRWRTWAVTRASNGAGKWRVTVRDAAGNKLDEATFDVTDDAKPAAPKPESKPATEPKPAA